MKTRRKSCLTCHLARYSVGPTNLVAPEASPDRHDRKLGKNNCSANSGRNFLGALHAESHVAIGVSNGNKCLKAGALTSPSLFLDGHDLQNLILESRSEEEVDDFKLLKQEDLY